jgi:hypothetical protein
MKLDVSREKVWAATIENRPGGLAEKLAPLADAGAGLEFVIARRTGDKGGGGVVFVTPISGAKQARVAKKAGFKQTNSLHGVQATGSNRAGLGAVMCQAVADAGINLRGLSAGVIGRRMVCHMAFDSPADATKAVRALKAIK